MRKNYLHFCFVAANKRKQNTPSPPACLLYSTEINQCSYGTLPSIAHYKDSFSILFIFKNRPEELYWHLNYFMWFYILSRDDNQMQFWEQVHYNSSTHLCLWQRKLFLLKQLFKLEFKKSEVNKAERVVLNYLNRGNR